MDKKKTEVQENGNLALVSKPLKQKRARCCNCKFAGAAFKIVGKTHYHCFDEKQYPPERMQNGDISPWETLREFSDKCGSHEFKQ